jgi:hypothetical protein
MLLGKSLERGLRGRRGLFKFWLINIAVSGPVSF